MPLLEALRPYLMLAGIAFLVGFLSYLAMGRPSPALAEEITSTAPAAVSAPDRAPTSNDPWNVPKEI